MTLCTAYIETGTSQNDNTVITSTQSVAIKTSREAAPLSHLHKQNKTNETNSGIKKEQQQKPSVIKIIIMIMIIIMIIIL